MEKPNYGLGNLYKDCLGLFYIFVTYLSYTIIGHFLNN